MKKTLFTTLLTFSLILASTVAFADYVETKYGNGDYDFVEVDWTHTYNGSIAGPFKATLSIWADDVDSANPDLNKKAEIDKVYLNNTFLGNLVSYGEFDNGRSGDKDRKSLTVFDITDYFINNSITTGDTLALHIDVYGTSSYYAMEFLSSTLRVSPTPIPGAAWLLGSGLVGLVGLRRRNRN